MRIIITFVILLLLLSQFMSGQSTDHSLDFNTRPEILQEVYNQHLPDLHVRKIHGRPYFFSYPKSEDHQFFKSRTPAEGIIFTVDDTIHSANMLYDLCSDRLIVWEPSAWAFIEPEEEFILGFRIFEKQSNTTFEFINTLPENDTTGTRSDIYQVLFEGESLHLYRKHKKEYMEDMKNGEFVIRFKKEERLILREAGKNIWIIRNRDFWKTYPEAKHEIKSFFRSSGIKIQRASDDQIQITAQFIDEKISQLNIKDPG